MPLQCKPPPTLNAILGVASVPLSCTNDAAALVAAMQERYPQLGNVDTLQPSAKVAKGEMRWP